MSSNLDHIRDEQHDTWNRFSAGWKKWDELVLGWLAPFGEAMIRLSPPGFHRLEQAQSLDLKVGGAELNTAVGLARLGRSLRAYP